MAENNNKYKTSNLPLAAAISFYSPIVEVDTSNFSRVLFTFNQDENLNKIINSYWQGKLQVEPQAYFNRLKFLKSRIYSEVKN